MNGARHKFLAGTGFAGDQNAGIGWRDLGDAREHVSEWCRSSDDLLEHRRLVDFFAQRNIFFLEPLLGPLAVIDIGPRGIPPRDAPLLVRYRDQAIVEPAILSVVSPEPCFVFKRR